MTTIAYKDGVLASDTRATWDDGVKSKCTKIWRITSKVEPVKGQVLLAAAGNLYIALIFRDWLEAGGEAGLYRWIDGEETDFDAIIVHKSGLYSSNQLCRITENEEPYWAAGTGCKYALGAMHCGKSAIGAVRVAAHFDAYTGGRIVSETLAPRARKKG